LRRPRLKVHHCAKNKNVISFCTTSYNMYILYTKLNNFIRMAYNSRDVRTAYSTSGTSGRYGKWDRCAGTLVMPVICCFVMCRPAVPQNPEYFRIFPISISHISLYKISLYRYFYLHLQNRAYYNGTHPASNILKFYSNNA
jgi:hypothetical protein